MKQQCRFCLAMIDTRGYLSHVHFRHRAYVQREFRQHAFIIIVRILEGWDLTFPEKALPAPKPDVKYTLRPVSKMLAPLPWMKVPKGYGVLEFLP